ncbi:hypothetical protein ACMYSQ_001770 [Aspergillus niger]
MIAWPSRFQLTLSPALQCSRYDNAACKLPTMTGSIWSSSSKVVVVAKSSAAAVPIRDVDIRYIHYLSALRATANCRNDLTSRNSLLLPHMSSSLLPAAPALAYTASQSATSNPYNAPLCL